MLEAFVHENTEPKACGTSKLISVIIVNYNSGDLLKGCIASLEKFIKVPFEVIVIDNDSRDNSFSGLASKHNVQLINSGQNLGFPKACNLGVKAASGQILHFLNPDAEVTEDINNCYEQAIGESERCIYVTRILDTSRPSSRSSHALPNFKNIFNLLLRRSKVEKWYIGASIVVSTELFHHLGGWSEEYFMYCEDVDFFYKARQAGVRTVETDSLVIHHQGGSSRGVFSERQRLERVERSAFIFANKFGLTLDYIVFRHLAFAKVLWRSPGQSMLEMRVFWRELLRSRSSKPIGPARQ